MALFFSAANPAEPPLLTISAPIGLQIEPSAGSIEVRGNGHNLSNNSVFPAPVRNGDVTGISLLPGNTIALVGGPVIFTGGVVTAESGRIELGSVEFGLVGLESNERGWQLNYDQINNFADLEFSEKALVDISGVGPGNIQLQGRQIEMRDSSILLVTHEGLAQGGKIEVNATESLTLTGGNPSTQLQAGINSTTLTGSQGTDIEISTRKLSLIDGGFITSTAIDGVGGNVRINATESVEVIGFAPFGFNPFSTISTASDGLGNAGFLEITTNRLTVLDGARVGSAVSIGSNGSGGEVVINEAELIEVIGIESNFLSPSIIFSSTLGNGNAASLTISTKRLIVDGGGRVDSSTLATGDAGSLTINASESIEINGRIPGSINPSEILAAANQIDPVLAQSVGLPLVPPSGESGNLNLNTPLLKITDGALAGVAHDGTGDAGLLNINAQEIVLADEGSITAVTNSGEGGNINIVGNNLQLRRGSEIIATAGGVGNGGNLNLNLDTIVALENSDIVANAFEGNGGNIQINTEGIFGTEFRNELTPESDITASSEFGVSGIVAIARPEVDPFYWIAAFIGATARPSR